MFRIDVKKWREAEKNAFRSDDLTLLYSIRAMARGRTHRKRARVVWDQLWRLTYEERKEIGAHGGTKLVDLDWEDQLKYVGDEWKKYVKEEPVEEVAKGA